MAKEAKGGGKTRLASRKALSWQLRSREKRFFLRARARMTTTTYDDDDVDGDNRKKLQESKPTVGGVDRGAFTPCYLPESCFAELSREWGTGSTRARIRLSWEWQGSGDAGHRDEERDGKPVEFRGQDGRAERNVENRRGRTSALLLEDRGREQRCVYPRSLVFSRGTRWFSFEHRSISPSTYPPPPISFYFYRFSEKVSV